LIVGFWFTATKSLYEIRSNLDKVAARYGVNGGPSVFYTDLCCPERDFLTDVFPTLKKNEDEAVEVLKFKGKIACSSELDDLSEIVSTLSQSAVVGIDCEWECSLLNMEDIKKMVCTLQLCNANVCLIYQFYHMENIPECLLALLKDASVTKVGWNCKGDCTRLKNDWNVDVMGLLDLYQVGRGSLQKQCSATLKKKLKKNYSTVISPWGALELTGQQKNYAATDAYACLLLHGEILVDIPHVDESADLFFGEDKADPVQKDVLHIMQMYEKVMSLKHPLWARFIRLISDAMKSEDDMGDVNTSDVNHFLKCGVAGHEEEKNYRLLVYYLSVTCLPSREELV
jgi:hypothetical protein